MSPPIGNKFWEIRSKSGRNPIFSSPDHLWESACEYFEWASSTPIEEEKIFSFQGEIIKGNVDLMRPFTIAGLCIFLDIGTQTLFDYAKRDDFSAVVEKIKGVIYEQKFAGAAVGLLNSNIIARDLGLRDGFDSSMRVNVVDAILADIEENDGLPRPSKD